MESTNDGVSLTIPHVNKDHGGLYYCGRIDLDVVTFSKGTFVSVTAGDKDVKVSVFQSSVSDSVPAGASVTLQCSVLSESRAAELQVLWFRAAPSQSHPQLIYTHHNSSLQCESESSTHTCVYNLSKNIFSLNDTGTYYCAVVLCGRSFSNGTRVQLENHLISVRPEVICLTAVVVVCVIVICVQAFIICKMRNCEQSGGFTFSRTDDGFPLTIPHINKDHGGLYFCGKIHLDTLTLSNGTFVSVTGDEDVKVSVFQSSVSDSVPAGASVTLQCSVLSESRAAELQVLWFRAAPSQSHPQIIYTHHNSSLQCESKSSTHTCVYNLSKNIFSLNDTGTYYCAVVLCGKIIFGNGTRVQLEDDLISVRPEVICLTAVVVVCVIVICVQAFIICKIRNCEQSGVRPQKYPVIKKTPDQLGFTFSRTDDGFPLTIPHINKDHGGLYFCGKIHLDTLTLSNGTFVSVTGDEDVKVSVNQSSVLNSVPAGASVTLQCSVLSESRAAELQVLWFRAAPSQSHPQIIYTHHNSSLQCESESSTHTCVYNLSKNIFSLNDTGTYYCAVVLCGKIIFGKGTRVQLEDDLNSVRPEVICLTAVVVVCVIVICVQAFIICKTRNCEQSGDHGGLYYCGNIYLDNLTFSNGTFVSVTGDKDVKVSVNQSSVSDSVPAGASVTLQCSVLSESRAAELQVLWFRAAPSQSHPQIIYTHHNSSHQCESESSTHTCVYNLSKNIFSLNDTGTYYCAVALCGKIIFGNGTRVQLVAPVDRVVMYLAVALGACLLVIVFHIITCKWRNCEHISVKAEEMSVQKTSSQSRDAAELIFAASHINKRSGTKERAHDNVYTEVIYSTVS
ncbi:hypothetical protein HF521_018183 [Silurus meridionalis]|uniref:Ig-like domain-containing protein n=1 Tax=Silurus meridionalis TaxID=175797 RepID=A0A8T0BJ24_SILME|nr:hypothetical protein HF521_018183 [Silurus meridionalis]